jgi:hypothetical protein
LVVGFAFFGGVGDGEGDEEGGDGDGLPKGMSPGLALGNVTPPSAAVGGGSGSGLL